ncbi:MAG: UDP-N-acetylmuramate--L-alanine ligase [candidate division Zixibacteria bacterium]|nr:UDP-N-acetylmuramate--L-alanine ligase [candidate division Zixibacteria bacterium]
MKFKKIKKLHFVGIGGTGMCGIAEILLNLGYKVTGSDLRSSDSTERLEKLGIEIFIGHKKENLSGVDVVVISSAVRDTNPEVISARENKIPVIRRAEMLGELMRLKFGIGVAGTHGKTTTTSMIGQILSEAGLDPTIIVGGRVKNLGSNAKLGQGEYLVAEADEFDRSFLQLTPTIAVVTTLEAEHLDYYKDLEEIKSVFTKFVNKVPFYGSVILCLDEATIQEIIPAIERPIISYGLVPQADLIAYSISFFENKSSFKVKYKDKELGEIILYVPGVHNVKNSLAAICVGLELDIPFEIMKKALFEFKGVNRRFEIKGEIKGVMMVDDYAHHPTEIKATLRAAREGWGKRIISVFQPHLFSRTKDFHKEFGKSFFDSEILIVSDIYPSREEPIPEITGELVASSAKEFGHKEVYYIPRKEDIVPFLLKVVKENDLVITMGAGDIYRVGEMLYSALNESKR